MPFSETISDIPVVILCGGKGTRLGQAADLPKPLVQVGDMPIIQHVVEIFARQGSTKFVLAAGYRWTEVNEWADRYQNSGSEIELSVIDTGLETETAGRVEAVKPLLNGDRFFLTYADGVGNVDLQNLIDFHLASQSTATITVVRPHLQFGVAMMNDQNQISGFHEKPRSEQWMNGGFMLLEPSVFESLVAPKPLEDDTLERLASSGQLSGFKHEGFWACLDTYKDALALNELANEQTPPWRKALCRNQLLLIP